MVLHIFH